MVSFYGCYYEPAVWGIGRGLKGQGLGLMALCHWSAPSGMQSADAGPTPILLATTR